MNRLNKEQLKASLPNSGVNLVVAGAGTGKTSSLVEKIKNTITIGEISPKNILILTFSRKAADEIKERIRSHIGKDADQIISGTFHSFCLGFLRGNSKTFTDTFGFNGAPSVLNEEAREALKKKMLHSSLDQFLGLPSNIVEGLWDNLDSIDKRTLKMLKVFGITDKLRDLMKQFKDLKRSKNLIDFNDMINFTIEILSNNKTIRKRINQRFQYVFVDEFQDTSEDNFRLLKLLLPDKDPNLFVVGDDWQSIYGFRGAKIDYIVNMKKYFPQVNIIKLKKNYRSRKEIVSISNKFIKKNKIRTSKKLISTKGNGGEIRGFQAESMEEELEILKNILKKEENHCDDIAILYRNNWQGKSIITNINDCKSIKYEKTKLMTIHSSKGLEFETVIITGVNDGIIPDMACDIEEERRLMYVGLTRAKERLYIIHHKTPMGEAARFAKELGFSTSQ
ncbi:MAG: ATP-dependent helicase [Spirochaetota bacterium]|nr:ATP-dependent helicase [Spirochaetota bacterium]